jgi:F-box protein 9
MSEGKTAVVDHRESGSNPIAAHLEDESDGDESPVWFREEEKWELTWPIWHMLPREERRSLARQHGYKTIGEFEEFMVLQQAVGDSARPYDNELLYRKNGTQQQTLVTSEKSDQAVGMRPLVRRGKSKEKDDDEDSVDSADTVEMDDVSRGTDDKVSIEIIIQNGGKILMLADDMLHRIFDYLNVDAYAQLALVSPHWKSFTRTEATYKRLCERLYLNQSKKRALHVSRFNNSYRVMLEKRPRIRAGGGVYVMKYARIRKIQRDMWTDIPAGAVLEMVYYRYLYFEENGRVLYALTPAPPHEMFPRLRRVCLTGHSDRSAVWGTYTVQKTCVTVSAKQEWHHVQLTLSIDLVNRVHGRYGCLTFVDHMTSVSGNFSDDWNSDRIVYDIPDEPFRFIKDKRL